MKTNHSPITAAQPPPPEPGGDGWRHWLASPPGRYALAWEQEQFDAAVADLFGYHALQCGLPGVDALRENRMRHRIHSRQADDDFASGELSENTPADLWLDDYEALPFDSQSLDLVVLAHVLEFACHPHQVLREVDRVLRPEGRVIVSGFNPVSLWGARQIIGRGIGQPFLPEAGQFIGLPRLRDWFKLLSFELERGRFGCYRPPCRSEKWLERTRFMEAAGDRWWPICGAIYFVSAVKRVRGMRLVGAIPSRARLRRAPVAVIAPRHVQRGAISGDTAISRDTGRHATSAADLLRPWAPRSVGSPATDTG